MRLSPFFLATLAAALIPSAAHAQRVFADVRIGEGPVSGHIIIASPSAPHDYHGPRDYPRYRVVEVYRMQRGAGWYRSHGYRPVQVWYDEDRDCYYDRYDRGRRGHVREIVIYQRGGRYYRDEDRDVHGRRDRRNERLAERDDYRARVDRRNEGGRN